MTKAKNEFVMDLRELALKCAGIDYDEDSKRNRLGVYNPVNDAYYMCCKYLDDLAEKAGYSEYYTNPACRYGSGNAIDGVALYFCYPETEYTPAGSILKKIFWFDVVL